MQRAFSLLTLGELERELLLELAMVVLINVNEFCMKLFKCA